MIRFAGVKAGEACTIVLRGATSQLLEEAERSVHDALAVLSQTVLETRTTLGGGTETLDSEQRALRIALTSLRGSLAPAWACRAGCAEMLMAKSVDEAAVNTAGKKSLAVEAFARALRQLPTILADNGGYDSSELVSQLRAAHAQGKSTFGLSTSPAAKLPRTRARPWQRHGANRAHAPVCLVLLLGDGARNLLDMDVGSIADMRERGIIESFKLKRQVVSSASEAAEMVLRVDDIIRAAPRCVHDRALRRRVRVCAAGSDRGGRVRRGRRSTTPSVLQEARWPLGTPPACARLHSMLRPEEAPPRLPSFPRPGL